LTKIVKSVRLTDEEISAGIGAVNYLIETAEIEEEDLIDVESLLYKLNCALNGKHIIKRIRKHV